MTADGATADSAAAQLAQEIKRLRKAADLSQPELAGMIGYTRQYVSMAERAGKNVPSQELIKALDKALAANGALIALRQNAKVEQAALRQDMTAMERPTGPVASPTVDAGSATTMSSGNSARVERNPVNRRSFLAVGGAAAFGTALSSQTRVLQALEIVTSGHADTLGVAIDCLNELISHYSEKLSVAPLAETYGDLLNVRSYAGGLLDRPGTSAPQRSDLTFAAGRLSNLLAVATSYMGDHESALVWCVDAERRGDESGSRDIAGWAALTRATMAYYQGRTSRSVELVVQGQAVAPMGTVARAKLAAHEMRARAMLGDTEGMTHAKRRATNAIADLPTNVATTGAFSIALAEDPPYTATSLLLLNRFQEAASATRSVINAAYPTSTHNRNRQSSSYARTLLILGLAEAGLGHIDEAAVAGRTALDSSGLVWPTLVLAGKLDQALIRGHKDAAEVVGYHDLYLDMTDRASSELRHHCSHLAPKEKE
ncbi:helix-turn-helix transcriptional regulator [Actinocrispum wychmicini]|uniref:Helix-turn-helix protein n=1 Tax=Actinocrispum wychmicini TaxID=1213861 RepID=A0A4R2IN38_9PSEU|nr:helix-turn-helix transcriptional regulator [Actinocrispum wychmicini]TCO46444.1 helix-turn-helix protein [Actinocrispum wychmicini]